ncbi:cytochrome c oxidase subunit VIc domain-containing protein [Phthorimaea operculella]|nr:cytochrome c oxidase subunit VIc domain-containing protein [Phthorimaea operculella]
MADTKALRKPRMRRLHSSWLKFHVATACLLACAGGFAFYTFVAQERIKKYEQFYANYDAEAEFEEMASKGLFQSSP